MTLSCKTTIDRKDHKQYLTVSRSYSDDCTCSLTEQNSIKQSILYVTQNYLSSISTRAYVLGISARSGYKYPKHNHVDCLVLKVTHQPFMIWSNNKNRINGFGQIWT